MSITYQSIQTSKEENQIQLFVRFTIYNTTAFCIALLQHGTTINTGNTVQTKNRLEKSDKYNFPTPTLF
jgi:hypothetical protein